MRFRRSASCLAALLAIAPWTATAQTITAAWQMQPYCNRVTLTLTPSPAGGFALQGTDDQCGAANPGSAVGHASFNAGGNVTLNFTIVTAPAAKPLHVSAIVSPSDGNGTWTDSVATTGSFVFFGAVPGLPPRPTRASGVPPASIIATDLAAGAVGSAQLAAGAVSGAKVLDGSLTAADLADAPRAAFVDVPSPPSPTTPQVVATLNLTAPAAGTVVANATIWTTIFQTPSVAAFAQCSITRGTTLELAGSTTVGSNPSGVTTSTYAAGAMTRGFVVSAGAVSVNLVCYRIGNLSLGPISMTAMYFP